MELVNVLEMTVSTDQNQLASAQQFLEQAVKDNLLGMLQQLSAILREVGNSAVARMQAGLQLKNALYSKDPAIFEHYRNRWRSFDEQARNFIKTNVVCSLGTEKFRPSSAPQCVAYIACAELPHNMWPDLIDVLSSHVTNCTNTSMMREAALEAISYICQDIDPDVIQAKSNQILTAIVHGMKKEESSKEVKLAATNALLNSLEFTKANFDKESERNFIMQVVCEASQSTDLQIKVAALQCLVKIMSLYYSYMEPYMGPALFAITIAAIKSDTDEVALQGIEFWSNVCDEELDLAIEASEAAEMARPPERNSMFYAKGALQFLVPLLCDRLAKQEEFDDDDEWNPCKAAGVCLMLMATCCENDIVPHVLPFVHKHIMCADWKYRDAAVMAFGSVLEGPDPDDLRKVVEEALPTLIAMFKDSSVVVRDTVAWTVGRVCELMQDVVIKEAYLPSLLDALEVGLWEEPRVATNICWALSSLAEAAYEAAEAQCEDKEPDTFVLSQKFQGLIERLLQTTDRPDCNQHNLRSAAYEALMELVKNSPKDCYDVVKTTTLIILERLQRVLGIEDSVSSSSDRAQVNDLQSLLCATLQSVLRKMSPEDALQISGNIMVALMHMFESSARGGAGGVQEDALLAVSTLVEVLGDKFSKYMDPFKPYLAMGLKNTAEHTVCLAAVGIVGDLCRALGSNVHVYCEEIMGLLIENLSDNSVHRAIKPQILSTFGDLALAIGPLFQNYLAIIMAILQQASQLQVDKNDYDMVDYLNELWEGCLEAYTGIVQGLKGDGDVPAADVQQIWPYVAYMVSFVEHVGRDDDHTDANVAACCGLIGDLLAAFGDKMLQLVDQDSISNLLTKGRRSKVNKTKTLATWATKEIRKLKVASSTTSW